MDLLRDDVVCGVRRVGNVVCQLYRVPADRSLEYAESSRNRLRGAPDQGQLVSGQSMELVVTRCAAAGTHRRLPDLHRSGVLVDRQST